MIEESGKTVQSFIEHLFRFYRNYDLLNWNGGYISIRKTRVAIIRMDLLNELCGALPDPYGIGRKIGESARIAFSVMRNDDSTKPSGRRRFFEDLTNLAGWGRFSEVPPNRIVVESPGPRNSEFLRGYIEGAVSTTLRVIQAQDDQIIFEIVKVDN